jgi:hypothetical protein
MVDCPLANYKGERSLSGLGKDTPNLKCLQPALVAASIVEVSRTYCEVKGSAEVLQSEE